VLMTALAMIIGMIPMALGTIFLTALIKLLQLK